MLTSIHVVTLLFTTAKVTTEVVRHTNFEQDAKLARDVAANVCTMCRRTEDSVHKQLLIHKSIKDIQ